MAFQEVPDTASLTFKFSGTGAGSLNLCVAQSTVYVRDETTPWSGAQLQKLADYGAAWWQSGKNGGVAARTQFSSSWGMEVCLAVDLTIPNGGQATASPATTVGSLAGDPAPPNCAVQIKAKGDAGGFPPFGFNFWPAGHEALLAGNAWSGTLTTAVRQLAIDFLTDINDPTAGGDINWAQVIVSRSGGTPAQLEAIREARSALKAAIAATRRTTALTNTLDGFFSRSEVASQRDRRASQ